MKNIDSMSQEELDAVCIEADAGHGEKMLAAVYDFLGRFVAYPSEQAHVAHSLWIIHAHLMDRWESTPRLAFLSPEPASGKTRAQSNNQSRMPIRASLAKSSSIRSRLCAAIQPSRLSRANRSLDHCYTSV